MTLAALNVVVGVTVMVAVPAATDTVAVPPAPPTVTASEWLVSSTGVPPILRNSVVSATLVTVITTWVRVWPASTVEVAGEENRSTGPLPAKSGVDVSVKVTAPPPFAVAVRVGSSLTGVMASVLVARLLSTTASLTLNSTVLLTPGSLLVLLKVIERSAV